jgi:hypothetical protein
MRHVCQEWDAILDFDAKKKRAAEAALFARRSIPAV